MDLSIYIDRIEERFDDPGELERIRAEALADDGLDPVDQQLVAERVGLYLADRDRADGPMDEDTVLDEDERAGA